MPMRILLLTWMKQKQDLSGLIHSLLLLKSLSFKLSMDQVKRVKNSGPDPVKAVHTCAWVEDLALIVLNAKEF